MTSRSVPHAVLALLALMTLAAPHNACAQQTTTIAMTGSGSAGYGDRVCSFSTTATANITADFAAMTLTVSISANYAVQPNPYGCTSYSASWSGIVIPLSQSGNSFSGSVTQNFACGTCASGEQSLQVSTQLVSEPSTSGPSTLSVTLSFTAQYQLYDPTLGAGFNNNSASGLGTLVEPQIQIVPPSQLSIGAGLPYNGWFTATGGTPPYLWCVLSGSECDTAQATLPSGFTLNLMTGLLSCCSTDAPIATVQNYPFTVQVMDTAGTIATGSFTLNILCAATVDLNPLGTSLSGLPFAISATFTSPTNVLSDYAQACGFAGFDWVQTVTETPTPSAVYAASAPTVPLTAPFSDPPLGGYTYQFNNPSYSKLQPNFATAYPYYYSPLDVPSGCAQGIGPGPIYTCRIQISSGPTLNFFDAPRDYLCSPSAPCLGFTSQLVGICGATSFECSSSGPSSPLYQWTWQSNYDGSGDGGIFEVQPINVLLPDPGTGTGGITITSINGVPSPSISVDPSAVTISTLQSLSVAITVAQTPGEPVPAGTVTLMSGSYTSAAATLDGSGSATFTIPAGSLPLGSDMLTVAYSPATAVAATYSQAWGTALVTVNPVTPQIVFAPTPTSQTYGTPIAASSLDATAQYNGSLVGGTLVYTTGACGGGGQVLTAGATILQAGSYSITACFTPSNADFTATSATVQYQVNPASQSITFGPIPVQLVGATTALNATATSGLLVSFQTLTPVVCSVSQASATMLSPGTCTIEATQGGGVDYLAATPVEVSFPVMGFSLTAEPQSETIKRGVLAVFLLKVTSVNGFAGNVRISCTGGPLASVCGDFPQTVYVRANGTALALSGILFRPQDAAGTYTITFTGDSGTDTSTATAQFTVK